MELVEKAPEARSLMLTVFDDSKHLLPHFVLERAKVLGHINEDSWDGDWVLQGALSTAARTTN